MLISPEPYAKRTVEGDLGVFVNFMHIVDKIGLKELKEEFPNIEQLTKHVKPLPETEEEIEFIERLTKEAVLTSLDRHAGTIRYIYGPTGKKTIAEGKDLTNIKYIIGTGGALTRLPRRISILRSVLEMKRGLKLYPGNDAKVLIDNDYIFASLGVLSKKYPKDALN